MSETDAFTPAMSAEAIDRFLDETFPQARAFPCAIDGIGRGWLTLRLPCDDGALRPGGTVSGPTMMTLADTAMYFLLLSQAGAARMTMAVTASLNINFLRRPAPTDLIARAELLRLGATLAVGAVTMRSHGDERVVAQATVTYALPRSSP